MGSTNDYDFDIAVSFAGEDRPIVQAIVDGLRSADVRTFYDHHYAVEMWGEDLVEYFDALYGKRARFMLMMVSRHYATKAWPRQERRAGLARALASDQVYILPVNMDGSELPPGMPQTTAYLDLRREGVRGVVAAIVEKVTGREDWSPDRAPRNETELQVLLRTLPPAWEYLYWAGCIYLELQGSEDLYLDHELGYSPPSGDSVGHEGAPKRLQAAVDEVRRLIHQFDLVWNPEAQRKAFGEPGDSGDAERIRHLAKRMTATYRDLLDWARNVRSVAVPDEYLRAFQLLSNLADEPIRAYREYVSTIMHEMDQLPTMIREREARGDEGMIELTLELTLTMEDQSVRAFTEEMDRLRMDGP